MSVEITVAMVVGAPYPADTVPPLSCSYIVYACHCVNWLSRSHKQSTFLLLPFSYLRFPMLCMGWAWVCNRILHISNTCTHTSTHTHKHICMQDGFSPLYSASQEGHDRIVEMLLQAGATVDLQMKVEDCYYDSTLFICHL